jgi:hypothetical protein
MFYMALKNKLENPDGLHQKYLIQKIVRPKKRKFFSSWFDSTDYDLVPMEPGFEGFVLRLDEGGDSKHVEACRKAVLTYAEEIKDYLPQLSKDLFDRYK